MANENLFTEKAADYAAGRSAYAPEAAELVRSLCPAGAAAADVGSGTGIFTWELLRGGFVTYAVEPNDAMRAEAERTLGGDPLFRSVAAPAEATTLSDASISLVTAASAFHWFDAEAFRRECGRILTPEGRVCLLFQVRIYDEFTRRQHHICEKYAENFVSLAHGWEQARQKLPMFFGDAYEIREFDFPLHYSREKFLARSLSSSYAPVPSSPHYIAYRDELARLTDEFFPGETVTVSNHTVLVWGKPQR